MHTRPAAVIGALLTIIAAWCAAGLVSLLVRLAPPLRKDHR
jgi:hypothetical protein